MMAWRAIAHLPLLKLLFASLSYAFPLTLSGSVLDSTKKPAGSEDEPDQWLYLTVAAILVIVGGAFSGLTIA